MKLRHDPESRAIAGISSGGICAWTVAWERPNEFRKVLSWVGSFTNIASGKTRREGGHNYEAMIRKTRQEADPRLPPGRRQRPRQQQRQLAAGQPADGQGPSIRGLRLSIRLRPGLPQQPPRPSHPARVAPLALARLQARHVGRHSVRLRRCNRRNARLRRGVAASDPSDPSDPTDRSDARRRPREPTPSGWCWCALRRRHMGTRLSQSTRQVPLAERCLKFPAESNPGARAAFVRPVACRRSSRRKR